VYTHLFQQTGTLVKLIFRQERWKIFIWLFGLVAVTLAVAAAYPSFYIDQESRLAYALTMSNPAMKAMLGPGYALEDYATVGPILGTDMLIFTAIAIAIMNILFVGRSTRADEEDGRIELIRSLPVGRLSYLSAAMIAAIITNVLLALLIGFGLYALNIEGIELEGSLLYGFNLGAVGLLSAAFTALFAQLAETSRGTTMLSFVVLIVAYLIRAVGDVSNEALSLISPLGWVVRTDVFVGNQWWPVLLSLVTAVVLIAVSYCLNPIRDLGAGFIPARKGREHASPFLQTLFGFTLRLQSINIIAWAIGVFLISAAFGAVMGDMETYFADMELLQAFFLAQDPDYSMTEQFIALLMAIMSLFCAIPAAITVLKLRGEENKNRAEHFFGRAVSRTQVLGTYVLLAVLVSVVMQLLVALGLWSVGAAVMEDAMTFETVFNSALVYLPALWIVIALAVLLLGVAPKAVGLVWFYVIYCFIVVYLGGVLEFPEWVRNLSIFEFVPQIPLDDLTFRPLIMMTLGSVAAVFLGFLGYNKRDITG
jgi:ABC-2 type transport system permease protein